jgi:DNA-binding PadR family transcriptional regulator
MHLGDFEQILLFAVLRLGPAAHGAAVRLEIERRIGRVVSPGAAYTALDRLEERGFVLSWIGETAAGRGGRRRKYYRLSAQGARALARSYADLRSMAAGLLPKLNALSEGGS